MPCDGAEGRSSWEAPACWMSCYMDASVLQKSHRHWSYCCCIFGSLHLANMRPLMGLEALIGTPFPCPSLHEPPAGSIPQAAAQPLPLVCGSSPELCQNVSNADSKASEQSSALYRFTPVVPHYLPHVCGVTVPGTWYEIFPNPLFIFPTAVLKSVPFSILNVVPLNESFLRTLSAIKENVHTCIVPSSLLFAPTRNACCAWHRDLSLCSADGCSTSSRRSPFTAKWHKPLPCPMVCGAWGSEHFKAML